MSSEENVPLSDFLEEALRIVENAEKDGLTLRVLGATAFKIHCPKFRELHRILGRELSDVDFVAHGEKENKVKNLLRKLGYEDVAHLSLYSGRSIFHSKSTGRHIDIFYDRLDFCHVIDLRKRMEIDYPTIPPSDLLLQKMQIVNLTEKDIKDTIVLLLEHEVGHGEKEMINTKYISGLLARDWGFCYTTKLNLGRVRNKVSDYEAITADQAESVRGKIDTLLNIIEDEPKSFGWKMRARAGPSKRWYKTVDDVER